jgi:hypothetical protein
MTANTEAQRIWTTTPASQQEAELAKLPPTKLIYGRLYQDYREAVRQRLLIAHRNGPGVTYLGMSALTRFVTADGLGGCDEV